MVQDDLLDKLLSRLEVFNLGLVIDPSSRLIIIVICLCSSSFLCFRIRLIPMF